MKSFKVALISAMIAGVVGCGSDSNDSAQASAKAVTAIDGYLVGAEVYVDRNDNGIADDNELIGSTNDKGRVVVPASDAGYSRIVRAVAGVTIDTDKGGRVPYTYELAADPDSDVITPYTTLAVIQDKSLDQIAKDYNLSPEIVAGDYVVAKQDSNDEAKQAHLLARSVVTELGRNINETIADVDFIENTLKLDTKVKSIGTDELDGSIVLLGDAGDAEKTSMPPTMAKFLGKNHYYSFSLNDFWRNWDGLGEWRFEYPATVNIDGDDYDLVIEDNSYFMVWNGSDCDVQYSLTQCRSEMQDDFVYLSDEFAIALSVDKDFNLYTSVNPKDDALSGMLPKAAKAEEFTGKTFYHLYDTSRRTDAMTPWMPKPQMDTQADISVTDGAAGLISIGGRAYTVLQSNRDMFIIKGGDNQPSILFKGKELASHLKETWEKATLTEPKNDE